MSLRTTQPVTQKQETKNKYIVDINDYRAQAVFQQMASDIHKGYQDYILTLSGFKAKLIAISEEELKLESLIASVSSKLTSIAEVQEATSVLITSINNESSSVNDLLKKNSNLHSFNSLIEDLNKKLVLLLKIRRAQTKEALDVLPTDRELKLSMIALMKLLKETQEYLNKEFHDENKDKAEFRSTLVVYVENSNAKFLKAKSVIERIAAIAAVQESLDSSEIPQCQNAIEEINAASLMSSKGRSIVPTRPIGPSSLVDARSAPLQDRMKMFATSAEQSNLQNKPERKTPPPIPPKPSTLQPTPASIPPKTKASVVDSGTFSGKHKEAKKVKEEKVKLSKEEKKREEKKSTKRKS